MNIYEIGENLAENTKLYPYYVHAVFGIIDSLQLVIHGCRVNDDGKSITLQASNIVTGAKTNSTSNMARIIYFYYYE